MATVLRPGWLPVTGDEVKLPESVPQFRCHQQPRLLLGYDSTIEISFFVGMDVLKRLCPDMSDAESGFLQAFDAALNRIHEVADKVYARGGKGSYACILAAEDF